MNCVPPIGLFSRDARVAFFSLLFLLTGFLTEAFGSTDPNGPVAQARRTSAAPVIDGRLEEPEWALAPIVSEFRQKEPVEGDAASEETRVRILYDQSFLYIGVELLDREASQIVE